MNIKIRFVKEEDAQELLEYAKQVGSETDNLSFGSEGLQISLDKEKEYIRDFLKSDRNMMFIATQDDKIVGNARIESYTRRFSHRADIGISVLRSHWGNKIGSLLMEHIIDFAKNVARVEIISLEVNTKNSVAISLYEKFGFKKIGIFERFFKVNDEYKNAYIMVLKLK